MRLPQRAVLRQHAVTVLAVGGLAVGVVVPLASADDESGLRDRRHQVEGRIDRVQGDLDDASREVSATTAVFDRAVADLATARERLGGVRSDLRDARALDRRRQRELDEAVATLEAARQDLRDGRAAMEEQRDTVRDTVVTLYTRGDPRLSSLSRFAGAGSMEELMLRDAAAGAVVGHENQGFDDLEQVEQQLDVRVTTVGEARDDVADRRREAAEQVRTTEGLVEDAAEAAADVQARVADARAARREARASRQDDRAALAALRQREARIKQQILAARGGGSYTGDTGGLLQAPASGPVTSPFGYRIHPIYRYYGLHDGTDFGAPCGSSAFAGASGRVVNEYRDDVYGHRLYLYIGTVNGASTTLVYNHLAGYAVGEGATVARGQVLGQVGSTGWSTGCHLHFTVLRDGVPVDPAGYL